MAAPLKDKEQVKIFILYLLDRIGYPLGFNTITAIMLQDNVVEFFDFAECFQELVDADLISAFPPPPGAEDDAETLYAANARGKQVAEGLSDNIMRGVRERSYRSALRHLSFEKQGAVINHTFTHENGEPIFKCAIRDREGTVFDLAIRADNEKQLERMRSNFVMRPEVVYRGLVALITGDVNYIFEE